MKTPAAAAAAAAGVGNDIPQHLPVAQPCAANQTSQTKRTNHSKIPLRIYSMPFDVFVDHLRTIYGDTAVDAMLAGIKRIDASGTPPAVPWPEPQRTPPAAATPKTIAQTSPATSTIRTWKTTTTTPTATRTRTSKHEGITPAQTALRAIQPWTTQPLAVLATTSTGSCSIACLDPTAATWL